MIDFASLTDAWGLLFDPMVLVFMVAGVSFGIALGAIPGLTGSLGIAVMLPVAFTLDPLPGLVFLLSMYTGSMFGGALTAVLLNTPGAPAAIATTFDGYPMTRDGQALRALGISIVASSLGGFFSSLLLLLFILPMAELALRFGPPEMVLIAVIGLMIISAVRSESFAKTLLAGCFGFLLGTVGMTSGGVQRGTWGSVFLIDGIPLIPALIGLFAITELFLLVRQRYVTGELPAKGSPRSLFSGMGEAVRMPVHLARSGLIGTFVGALPAAGASIAAIVSWNEARRWAKRPERFGKGSPEGLASAEAANSASEDGSLATMLVLGIPGSPATAMLLGAIVMYGWVPGPRLFIDHTAILYGALTAQLIQALLVVPLGIGFAFVADRLVKAPTRVLVPVVAVFCVLGTFSLRNLMFDVIVMFAFGVMGYFLRKYGYPPIAVVLGLILGPIADREFIRTYQMFGDNMVGGALQRPLTQGLLVIVVALLALGLWRRRRAKRSGSGGGDDPVSALRQKVVESIDDPNDSATSGDDRDDDGTSSRL